MAARKSQNQINKYVLDVDDDQTDGSTKHV